MTMVNGLGYLPKIQLMESPVVFGALYSMSLDKNESICIVHKHSHFMMDIKKKDSSNVAKERIYECTSL
jgi:hypothetical protein